MSSSEITDAEVLIAGSSFKMSSTESDEPCDVWIVSLTLGIACSTTGLAICGSTSTPTLYEGVGISDVSTGAADY